MGIGIVWSLFEHTIALFVSVAAMASPSPLAKIFGVIGIIVSVIGILSMWYIVFKGRDEFQKDLESGEITNGFFGKEEETNEESSETDENADR